MKHHDRIVIDPTILVGKPVVKGTRLSVDYLVGQLAQGWTESEILRNYPSLQREDLLACWAYACEAREIQNTSTDARLTGLEQFLEFWLGPRHPEYGEPADSLSKIELPDPLRRFYAFAGRWPPAFPPYCMNRFGKQDRFLPLEPGPHGSVRRSGAYIVFLAENEGGWAAATLPSGNDPDVWVSEDDSTPVATWRRLTNPLSHFLVTFVLQELMFGSDFGDCHEEALAVLANAGCTVEPIWLNAEYAYEEMRHSYFLVDGRILVRRDIGNLTPGYQWYGFNDNAVANLLEGLHLPRPLL